jgi:hypothetical protein
MAAGYSPHPLFKKLGLKEGFKVKLINPPENYNQLIDGFADKIVFKNKLTADMDFIHFFTNKNKELEKILPELMQEIKKDGIIWVSWYKKRCGKATELTENIIRNTALAIGLVDVKVCAIDDDWSGLKLVFRLKDR